jgi:hypothetical protein
MQIGSLLERVKLIQEESNKTNTKEIVHCNFQPIPFGFFGAIDPTVKLDPRLSDVRVHHGQKEEDHPEG